MKSIMLKSSTAERLLWTILLCLCSCAAVTPYDRSEYGFNSYEPDTQLGFYSGELCNSIEVDHVVSLQEAHFAGAWRWSTEKKEAFANDRENHVAACVSVNRSKGTSGPEGFLRKSRDGEGVDFEFVDYCLYVATYNNVVDKWNLDIEPSDCNI